MPGFKVREALFRWSQLALFCVLKALADSLLRIGTGRSVEQTLAGLGVLY